MRKKRIEANEEVMAKYAKDFVPCYVAIGSNLGDSIEFLHKAIIAIGSHSDIKTLISSRFYQSKPHGPKNQPDYHNAAVYFETTLDAEKLLDVLQQIENANARVRKGVERWGARTLDLDLLFYGDQTFNTKRLIVPHPQICERVFVLYPLRDLVEGFERRASDLKINETTTLQDCIDKLAEAEKNSIKDLGYV
jgi:2-amino-4-hydroxy-6-hydroxymethyldihydropteridine diphosphokinase